MEVCYEMSGMCWRRAGFSLAVFCAVMIASTAGGVDHATRTPKITKCPKGLYQPSRDLSPLSDCVRCSVCPLNQIVRKPCSAHLDTVCGPFYEFNNFQQGPSSKNQDTGAAKDQREKSQVGEQSGTTSQDLLIAAQKANQLITSSQTKGPSVQSNEEYWKELCFGLIGALAAICILAFIYVVITQMKSRSHEHKSISIADSDDPTIYYRTRVFSGDDLSSAECHGNLGRSEVTINKGSSKLRFLRKIFGARSNGYFSEVCEVDSRGLLPLHIIPNQDSPDLGTPRNLSRLLAPVPIHSVSTDSGLSAGSSML